MRNLEVQEPDSGVGACPAGQVVSRLNANAKPTCVSASGAAGPINTLPAQSGTYNGQAQQFTNLGGVTSTGPTSITGSQTNGSDQISKLCVNGVCPVTAFGALCNGSHDDAPAFTAAIAAAGAAGSGMGIFVPAATTGNGGLGCRLNSLVSFTPSGGTPLIRMYGVTATANGGSGSRIYVANSTGGFLFTTSTNIMEIDHLTFDTGSFGSDVPYAVHWVSSSSVNMHDITCNAQFRTHKFTKCLWLTGTQKSQFNRIYSYANATAMYLDDDGSAVSSNQNTISDLHSNSDTAVGLDMEGGVSENNILNGFVSE